MTTYTSPFPQISSPSPFNGSSCSDVRFENGYIIRTVPSMLSAKGFTAVNMKDKRDIIDGLIKPKKTRRASVPTDMPSFQACKSTRPPNDKLLPAIPEDADEPCLRPRFFSVGSNTASRSSLASLALSQPRTGTISSSSSSSQDSCGLLCVRK